MMAHSNLDVCIRFPFAKEFLSFELFFIFLITFLKGSWKSCIIFVGKREVLLYN